MPGHWEPWPGRTKTVLPGVVAWFWMRWGWGWSVVRAWSAVRSSWGGGGVGAGGEGGGGGGGVGVGGGGGVGVQAGGVVAQCLGTARRQHERQRGRHAF